MSDFTFGPSLLADQEAEKARAAKIFADRQAAADPSLAASTAAEKKRLARQALTEDVLGATHSVMSQFDTTRNPDAAHNLATYGKEALHPGAQDWEYIDATTADRFRAAISASEDPQETEYRLQTGYFLSKLQGIPLEEAIQNQDSILSSWRASALSPRDALEAVGTTWKAAFIGTEIAKLAYQLWQKGYGGGAGSIGAGEAGAQARAGSWGNLENDPLYLKILELEKQMPAPDILKRNLPTEALKNLGQFMPSALESMRAGALGGAAGAAGAAGLFAASGAAEVALAAGPIGVLSIPTVALLGFQVGAAQGAGMKSLEIETGSAFYDLLRFQDPQTGARINPDAALLYSGIYGGLAAAVESLQMGSFFKAFPMLGDAAKKALTKAAQGALEDRGAQAARSGVLQRALGRWMGAQASDLGQRAGDIAAETSQEVLQQALQLGANEFARQVTERMDGTEIQPATLAEVRDSLVQTAVQASLGFATAHVIPAGMKMLVRGAQEGKSAVRTAAALGSEEKTPQINKEVSPEAASVFAKRVAEPLPAGTYAQPREIIEGDQYVLKAGNKDSGDRLGQLRYEIDPEAQSVNVLGLEKGRDPNVNAFLMKTLAARYPGWEIQFDPQSSTQAALRDYLVSQNPRGPEAGLQFFEAPQATPDRISMDYLRSRIQEVAPTWTKDAVDVTMNVLPMWARRMGMTAEELANGALDPQVFGQIIDKRGVAAQAATGAFKPVRGNDGWFRGIIDMAPRANPSTALHEMTHAVINFARQAQETPQVAQFLQELEAALGVVDGNWEAEFAGWTDQYKGGNRSFLEAITYGLEDYFATGQAPKPELEGLFRKLAQWILDIYEGLKGARVKLSPEMTAYFDNLVGGEGSPFLAERQSVNEAGLAAEERTLAGAAPGQGHEIGAPGVSAPHPAPPDAPTAQFERPIPNDLYQNERRRQIAGARRDLAEAQRLAAEGKPAEEIRAATGWSQHAGEWRQDKSFTSAPEYQTQAPEEAARQEPRPTGETPLGPATFEAKGYPEEGPTEDAPDPGVLFQYVGEKAQLEEGERQNLETAKAMDAAGKDSETVRLATGWFKGKYDGKWRLETNDSSLKIKAPFPNKGQKWGEIYKARTAAKITSGDYGILLGELIDYPELFKKYPDMAGIAIASEDLGAGGRGSYSPKGIDPEKITLAANLSMAEISAVLVHEIQHMLQRREGFAKGGNRESYFDEYRKLEARVTQLNQQMNAASKAGDKIKYEQAIEERQQIVPRILELQGIYGVVGDDQYTRTAGEIEARDVASRISLSREERTNLAPYSSENISRENSIVLFQGDFGRKLPVEEGMAAQGIKALLEAKDGFVEHAAYREEIGWIDIPWGVPGDMDKDFAGGWGISHIKAKHEWQDEILGKLALILRTGRVIQDPEFRNRRDIILGKYKAVIQFSRDGKPEPWLVTAYIPERLRRIKDTPAESVQQTVRPAVTGTASPSPTKADGVGGAAERTTPANRRKIIVRRKPGPGNTLDRNNIKPDKTLFQADTNSPEFKAWFGDSKVVDAEGKPLIVYHGTAAAFDAFDISKAKDKEGRARGLGWGKDKFYFTENKAAAQVAADYAKTQGKGKNPNVLAVYLHISNPITASEYTARISGIKGTGAERDGAISELDASLKSQGIDGIVDKVSGGMAVFSPTQIKSIDNRGTWDPNDPRILYQGERLADSQTLLYQGGEEDEAGMANLKEIAKTFPSWQEFAGYMDAMMTDDPNVPQDLPAIEKQTWYKDLWESARQMKPIDLEDWLRRLEADSHSGLMDFLEGIWNEILLPGAAQSMRYGDEETQAAAERSGDMKRELAETIVAAAQRVGSGRRTFDPRFLASLMGTIRKNPEEYARIYGEIMGQPAVAELGRKAEEAKYADIKDSKISEKRLSISQRAALAAQIRDEKLASDVRGGRVQMDEKAKAYLDKLTAEQKAAKKKIADLTAEVKIDEATLSEQDRRLAAARVESGRTKAEIAKAKSHLEKFLAKGQKIPAGYEGKIRAQEDRAKSIRQQLARVGDYQVLEEQQQNLERRLSRASLQLEEYRARGESSPPELLALRSSLADQLRKLEPRLKAASAAWKDNAGLQTHLAKLEALSQAKEDFQVREAEKKALKKLRAYQEGLVKQIMRERIRSQNPKKGDEALTSTVYITQARAISQIQDLIDPHFRSEKTQKDIDLLRSELEKNPDLAREVPREWLKRAAGKNLNEMTLQELEQTAREVQNLRDLGRHLLAIQHKDRMDWIEGQQSRIIDIITHTHGFVEPKGFQAERTFAERFKDRVRTADYAFLNMRRIANKLDGGTDGANVELLWHEMNRKYRKEMQGIDRRTATIMQAFTGAGVDTREWYNTVVEIKNAGPGGATETLRKSDLLALELAFRNEDSRAAALYGVFFSATERKEHKGDEDWFMAAGADRFTAIRAAIDSVITEQDQQVLETMAKDAEETGNRLSAIVAEVENRLLQTVSDYFPIRRQGVTQEPIDVQIGGDMLNRTPGLKRPPKNGFTRSRTTVPPWNQTAIKLDLLSTWLESIQAQEHYIATAEYAKKLDAVYTNPYIQENIQGLLGAPGVDYVKEYIAEVKNPGELANLKNWQSAIRYLRGNLGAAYLTFRTSSALKQLLTNGWASLPYAGPRMFLESLNCMANPAKYLRETEEMSTFLKHRTRDITYQAIKEAKANTPATKALLEAQKFGVKGLELADRFPVAIAWRSIYEKALIEFKGDEMKAVEKADDLIMKSQPSARGADLAPIYRDKGEALRLLLQFTQSINVIWQNLRYDLPNSVKNHQFSTAIGILISYAIAGIILNAVTTRPPDDETDEEKMRRLAFYSITQATDSIPLIGQDATRFVRGLITGEKSPTYPSTFLPGAGDIFDGMSKITAGDWQKGIEKFAIGSGMILGVPTSGVKELRRIAEGDFEALLGRQKK